jgi:acetylornithine/succinyldiaminopimelate/putrescine aminotransferase
MANGLPLAAVVGPRELMREFEDVFVSSTFGGDTLALAACLPPLEVYRREPSSSTSGGWAGVFRTASARSPRGWACPRGPWAIPSIPRS